MDACIFPFGKILEVAHPALGLCQVFGSEEEGDCGIALFGGAHLLHGLQIFGTQLFEF